MRPAAAKFNPLDESRPLWLVLLLFLIPLMLSNVLQSLGGTLAAIYLGRLVGIHALAAASSVFPIIFFLVSFVIGVCSGATVLIGQAHGAGNNEKVRQIAGSALFAVLVLSLVLGTLGAYFAQPMLAVLGTPHDIALIATSYARIIFITLPILFAYLIYTTLMRGTGDSTTPFYALIGGTILTAALTPVFILGAFGLPRLETNGAAIAGALSSSLSLTGLLIYLKRQGSPLALDRAMLAEVRPNWPLVRQIVRLGIPAAVNLVMISLSEIAVLRFVNSFGSTATAAYGAYVQIIGYVQFPAISIGIAASIFCAQAIGARKLERVYRVVRSAVALNYALEGVLILLCYLFSYAATSLFITDPKTVVVAQRLLHITLWSYAIFGNARVLTGTMLSSGVVIWPMVISIFSIWGVEVPVAYYLMHRIGLEGVWYGYPAAFVVAIVLQTLYYEFFWKKKTHERLV